MPTDVVAIMLLMRHTRSAAQLLHRLERCGFVRHNTFTLGPLLALQCLRLWTLTPAGIALVSEQAGPEQDTATKPRKPPRMELHTRVAAYRLLATRLRDADGPVRVVGWEQPWIRSATEPWSNRRRHVRIPAAAIVAHQAATGVTMERLLLLPDVGTAPLSSFRSLVRGLTAFSHQGTDPTGRASLLVVGVSGSNNPRSRMSAWQSLLARVAAKMGQPPLRARIVECPELSPRGARDIRQRSSQCDQVLSLVARHPLLTREQLAQLIGTSNKRADEVIESLAAARLVRTHHLDVALTDVLEPSSKRKRSLVVIELTPAGRRDCAARLLLSSTRADRYHGLLGLPGNTVRMRQLAHTIGANAIMVAFASCARRARQNRGDDAFEDWRSAAACARGRFRPDGYGCYRRKSTRFGFFLEYDRGTEHPRHYLAKFATYATYGASAACRANFNSLPALLVVATTDQSEARVAQHVYMAEQHHANWTWRTFLTTTGRIAIDPSGVLGPDLATAGRGGSGMCC